MMNKKSVLTLLCASYLLSGCATVGEGNKEKIIAKHKEDSALQKDYPATNKTTSLPLLLSPVKEKVVTPVSFELNGALMDASIEKVANEIGYALVIASDADRTVRVKASVKEVDAIGAIKEIAYAGNHVAVFDNEHKRIFLTKKATHTYRIPQSVMKNLTSDISIGGDMASISRSSGGGGGQQQQQQQQGGNIASKFTVEGKSASSRSELEDLLKDMAGKDGYIHISSETGTVTVRSNSDGLIRIKKYLEKLVKSAMTQVQLEVSMAEITITDELSYGIDWTQIFASSGVSATLGGAIPTTSTGQVMVTSASTNAILRALEKKSNVRVFNKPMQLTNNHVPAILIDGERIPYLGSAAPSAGGAGGFVTNTQTTQVSYAVDGMSISLVPDVLSDNELMVSIMPVLSKVGDMSTFRLGDGTVLTAPRIKTKQNFTQTTIENGKTIVIAGTRYKDSLDSASGLPGTSDSTFGQFFGGFSKNNYEKELVIMVRPTIIPPKKLQILEAESI